MKPGLFGILAATLLCVSMNCVKIQAQSEADTFSEGMKRLQEQKWSEAAATFEKIVKTEPKNGRAWFQLGTALHWMHEYEEAVDAFQKAIEIGNNPQSMYSLARSFACLNRKADALDWLRKALNSGFRRTSLLKTDEDLATLRTDPRFNEILILGEQMTKPCLFQSAHQEFDFWIGEWTVQDNKTGVTVGSSNIQRAENGCVVLENWTGSVTGRSINFYDSSLGKWRQTWVDSLGGVSEFVGLYKDAAMRFEGESHTTAGEKISRRLTFFNLGQDKVRQFSEASVDGGRTWKVDYDFLYVRK